MNGRGKKSSGAFLLKILVTAALLLALASSVAMAAETESYYIRSGDSLNSVAAAYDLTLAELLALNPDITDPNAIYVGQEIQVPKPEAPGTVAAQCPQYYAVQSGDTWTSVATKLGVDAGILALINNLTVDQPLAAGASLCVPGAPPASDDMADDKTMDDDKAMDDKTMDDKTMDDDKAMDDKPTEPTVEKPMADSKAPTKLPKPGEGQGKYHTIARGEYLSLIARRNSCTAQVLAAVNNIANPSLVFVNSRIWIPANCDELRNLVPALRPAPRPAPRPTPVAPRAPQPSTPPAAPRPSAPPAVPQPTTPPPAPVQTPFNYTSHGPWTAEYFNNAHVRGGPVVTRRDAQIVFSWGAASPAAGVPSDGFSVRWTGTFYFTGAEQRFIALADDGIRVWIDDTLLINGWKEQSNTLYYKDFAPRPGNHVVRVEYYDARADATAVVNWARK